MPTNKKNHAVGMAISYLPPRKTAGRRSAPPPKKPPDRATVSVLVPIWCDFTPKSEPISEKIPKLSPDACGRVTPARPTRKTLCLFFISPAEFLFQLKGSDFLAVRPLQAVEASGLRSGGKAAIPLHARVSLSVQRNLYTSKQIFVSCVQQYFFFHFLYTFESS